MAKQDNSARSRQDYNQKKQLRRYQIIMAIFSLFIILSMVLSLVNW